MFKDLLKIWSEDSLLNEAIASTEKMFKENNKLVDDSLEALFENKKFDFDVYKEDKRINHFEKDIRKKVLEHLTINPQKDVSAALILLGVVRDIERIGDYVKNYYELDKLYDRKFMGNQYTERLRDIKTSFIKYSQRTREAFTDGNEGLAKEIIDWYYDDFSSRINHLIKNIMNDNIDKQDAIAYVLLSRYLKRSGAHLANIASSVSNPFHKIGFRTKNRKEEEIKSST